MKAIKKRLADWLEKVSVGAFAVGLFQGDKLGMLVAAISFIMSMWLTYLLEKKP